MERSKILMGIVFINLLVTATLGWYVMFSKQRIVYIDSTKLLNGYKGMQDARDAYKKKASAWSANVDTLANEVQKMIFRYEKEAARMTSRERDLNKELIRSKQKQLADYQQALHTQAQQEDSKMTGDVVIQVNAFLKKYGDKNGYTIILAATEYGNLAFADEDLDITDEILAGLNREYGGQ